MVNHTGDDAVNLRARAQDAYHGKLFTKPLPMDIAIHLVYTDIFSCLNRSHRNGQLVLNDVVLLQNWWN